MSMNNTFASNELTEVASLLGVAAWCGILGVCCLMFLMACYWDRRLYAVDNLVCLLIRCIRLYPKLLASKSGADLKGWRGNPAAMAKHASKLGFEVQDFMVPKAKVPGREEDMLVRVFRPRAEAPSPWPLVIWFHGGGMCIGGADDDTLKTPGGLLDRFKGKAVIASVEYRLAPEHIFPAGAEDAMAAAEYLQASAAALGCDPQRVCVSGVSAGGYLAALAHQAARDRSFPLKAAVILAPMARRGATTQSHVENGSFAILPATGIEWFWNTYAPDPAMAKDPRCEPCRGIAGRGVAAGKPLAPCLLLTCDFDVLRDEGLEYADALRKAGTEVEHVSARTTHSAYYADKERTEYVFAWWMRVLAIDSSSTPLLGP